MWWRHHDVISRFTRTCQYPTTYQVSTWSHNYLGNYTCVSSKSAPLRPRHVTPDDVIDLKLHTYDGCLTVNACVKFEWLQKTSPHTSSKSPFWQVFNLPLEGAVAFCDVINIFFELPTLARHLRPWKATS